MPRNTIGSTPFPLRLVDKDGDITAEDIQTSFGKSSAVTICIRSATGPAKRGGYFFHIEHVDGIDEYRLYDFEQNIVATRTLDQLVRFVMHCCGRRFDEESHILCHSSVNLKQDEAEPA